MSQGNDSACDANLNGTDDEKVGKVRKREREKGEKDWLMNQ